MSDYLTALIAKSLNTRAAVRPRLASRFEPQGVGESSFTPSAEPGMVAEQQTFEEVDEVASGRPTVVQSARGPHVDASPRAIFAEPQSPSEPAGGSAATTAAPSHAPATQLRRTVRRSARHSPVTELEPAVQQREIERTGLSKDSAPENASQPKVPRDQGISDVSPARVVLQPQVTPRVEPAPVAAPAPVSALTPTIQVTIGRIELRSNTSPPLPKPRPAPIRRGPALSLDAYLKQRNGGK